MVDLKFQPALSLADVRPGRMRSCMLGSREIVVCHTKDGVFAVDNVCTHAFARMSEGHLKGTRLICPLHGATFDVRTGRVLGGPTSTPLATYRTRIVDGSIEVELPAAEPKESAGEPSGSD